MREEQGEREADEEVRSFLELAVDEKMKEGMNREELARAVRLERGSLEITKEVIRDSDWESFLERHRSEGKCKDINFLGIA